MLQVPGYSITSKVNEGSSTIIFRAIATETGQSAILKIPKGEYPTPRELATLRQEYLLLRSIDIIGVVKTFGLERYGNGLALILEDLRGQTLAAVERAGQGLWRRIQPATRRFVPVRGPAQAFPLGLLWGWLPCGLSLSLLTSAFMNWYNAHIRLVER